jgi:hypothetical protein
VEAKLKEENLVNHPPWVDKTIELYEAATVRHGIIVVGPSGNFFSFSSILIRSLLDYTNKFVCGASFHSLYRLGVGKSCCRDNLQI